MPASTSSAAESRPRQQAELDTPSVSLNNAQRPAVAHRSRSRYLPSRIPKRTAAARPWSWNEIDERTVRNHSSQQNANAPTSSQSSSPSSSSQTKRSQHTITSKRRYPRVSARGSLNNTLQTAGRHRLSAIHTHCTPVAATGINLPWSCTTFHPGQKASAYRVLDACFGTCPSLTP